MTTFTDLVAAVVVHSSAMALSHFGATMEPTQIERPQAASERVVARTPLRRVPNKFTQERPAKPQRDGGTDIKV